MKIAVANGDGIGPEIMAAVLKVFSAANVPLEYEEGDSNAPKVNRSLKKEWLSFNLAGRD